MDITFALTPADIAATVLDFSDAEFAVAPALDVQEREVRLLDSDFEGVAIAAQGRIDVDAQATLPIAIALRCDGGRDWDLPLGDNGLLVATQMETGRVNVVPALVPPKVLESRAGPRASRAGPDRPPAEELEGHGAQIAWTEVRSRVDVPWRSGAWSFGLLNFDRMSNAVRVELEGGAAVALGGGGAARAVDPLPAALVSEWPSYLPGDRTPPMPAQGVKFQVELDEQGLASTLRVDAAFALPAPVHVLAPGLTLDDGGQEQDVAAVVPVTLLLVGTNTFFPWRRDFAVPVYGTAVEAGDAIAGYLSLDAFSDATVPGPGEYACYLVLDGAIYGSQIIRVTR